MNRIGILELQGDFALHHCIFKDMGIESVSVKLPKDLDGIEGLVIPGGESTTMSLLIDKFDLREPILSFAINYPIMGTCAGLILIIRLAGSTIRVIEYLSREKRLWTPDHVIN